MPSTFKLNPRFGDAILQLATGIQDAADTAMEKVVAKAEQDANRIYRWRRPGVYTETEKGGNGTWTWTVTGLSAESITGYIVSPRTAPVALAGITAGSTTITRTGKYGRVRTYRHEHTTNAALVSPPSARPGTVIGVLTIYSAYAPYLQRKEQLGGNFPSGKPSAGEVVTIEVFARNWENVYVPLITKTMETIMGRIARSFR